MASKYDYYRHTAAVAHLTPTQMSAYRKRKRQLKKMYANYEATNVLSRPAANATQVGQSNHDASGWFLTFILVIAGPLAFMGWLVYVGAWPLAIGVLCLCAPAWEDWFTPRTK